MAGLSSNKKVSRVARTGGGRRKGANSTVGVYATMIAIALVGSVLVGFSYQERQDKVDPGNTAPVTKTETRAGDHWYQAYGVYLCDKFAPNINSDADPYGIATKNDGVIYIRPFVKSAAGKSATFGKFAKAVDLKLTSKSVQLPNDGEKYENGKKCGDKGGELKTKVWTNAKDPNSGKEVPGNPADVRLTDNGAIVVAFVADGTDIPLPPSVDNIEKARSTDPENAASSTPVTEETTPAAPITSTTSTTGAP